MTNKMDLKGVICAAVTPLKNGKPDADNLQRHLRRLAAEGCDGVLLLGTTGEGPSMGMAERSDIVEAAVAAKAGMKILVGTGTPSLSDTIHLTRRAFEQGADAVVTLPPYYFKKASDAGVIDYFKQVFDEAVPDDKLLLLYHIPQVSGMPVTLGVLEGVMKYAGNRMAGIKDSGGEIDHARELCQKFPELRVFVGSDSLLLDGLCAGAAGCITAAANVIAPLAVKTYRAFIAGEDADPLQEVLSQARAVMDAYQPFPPSLKSILAHQYGTEGWEVRPPLTPLPADQQQELLRRLAEFA